MAIVVLVLWLFTAGAGFYLLVTSSLGRDRSAPATPAAQPTAASVAVPAAPAAQQASGSAAPSPSRREVRRAVRDRFDPPSLVAAKQAAAVPSPRALLEFAHPACGIIGLAFWLGYTFVHHLMLGWIAFGLVAVTACLGLTWFTVNTRAARRHQDEPSFSRRLIALHGAAAAVTFALAALTALAVRG
jgi:hypothetical protein